MKAVRVMGENKLVAESLIEKRKEKKNKATKKKTWQCYF